MIDPNAQIVQALQGGALGQDPRLADRVYEGNLPFVYGRRGTNDLPQNWQNEMPFQKTQPVPADGAMNGLFGVPPQALTRMAGDVMPLPINPTTALTAGKPPLFEIAEGQKRIKAGDPNVLQAPNRELWQERMKARSQLGL